ncbi:hypothetical protein DRJ71_18530, partial [Enterococcus faecalis]
KTESKTEEKIFHPGGRTDWRSTPVRSIWLAFNARTEHGSGVERQKQATSWRSTPGMCPEERTGAERQKQAWNWRSTPETCCTWALNAQNVHQWVF